MEKLPVAMENRRPSRAARNDEEEEEEEEALVAKVGSGNSARSDDEENPHGAANSACSDGEDNPPGTANSACSGDEDNLHGTANSSCSDDSTRSDKGEYPHGTAYSGLSKDEIGGASARHAAEPMLSTSEEGPLNKTVSGSPAGAGEAKPWRLFPGLDKDTELANKIKAIVFKEAAAPKDKALVGIAACTAVSSDKYLSDDQEKATVLGFPPPSKAPTPGAPPKKMGIDPEVWQGSFTVPPGALSANEEINRLNVETVETYDSMAVVLRAKQASALVAVMKEDREDEIKDEALKDCIRTIREVGRDLRKKVRLLGGTPINEPLKYLREKYHLASF